ncbi:hypothetical protein IQ07DRAFT_683569 [Pyrenochaeta sp. DS3sAY3a]|nr:hypothetical protein IQ07DRAFT_683569 [Pyrenochaeta sp. DS3sAY3a]
MNAVWGVKSTLAFADIQGCDPVKAGTSTYEVASVITAMASVIRRLECLIQVKHESPGASITYRTPYRAQQQLAENLRAYSVHQAEEAGDHYLAEQLSLVEFTTADGYMGRDKSFAICDLAGRQDFAADRRRSLVILTRAPDSMEIIAMLQLFDTALVASCEPSHSARPWLSLGRREQRSQLLQRSEGSMSLRGRVSHHRLASGPRALEVPE